MVFPLALSPRSLKNSLVHANFRYSFPMVDEQVQGGALKRQYDIKGFRPSMGKPPIK